MKPHRLTQEDVSKLREMQIRYEICGSYGKNEHKRIMFVFEVGSGIVTWQVYDHNNLELETGFLNHAVEKYNEL